MYCSCHETLLLPHLMKDSRKLEHAFILVVMPLVSIIIMKDQVKELPHFALRAFAIGVGVEKGENELVAGRFHVDPLYGVWKQWSNSTV